jgi:murein DD-endopeptidase MepM/ murein hydrolase activator NlpD
MKLKILILILFLPAIAGADSAWPGGIAFLDLGPADGDPPVVEFNGKRVLVMNDDGQWRAAVGVPLSAATGRASITFANDITMSFDVVEHAYAEEHLQVARSYVSLSEEDLARYHRERKVIDAALNNWRDVPLTGVALNSPVEGPRSSSFGKRRFFNNEPRSPHSGMDIAVPEGMPIQAPRGGVVTETGDFYFNGNTVFLDHGQGFVTMYCHLSEIGVDKGQQIAAGDVIGLVGKTGRVTGAHLHFGAYLNGNAVDPALLLAEGR